MTHLLGLTLSSTTGYQSIINLIVLAKIIIGIHLLIAKLCDNL
jgi:hypothetical protein